MRASSVRNSAYCCCREGSRWVAGASGKSLRERARRVGGARGGCRAARQLCRSLWGLRLRFGALSSPVGTKRSRPHRRSRPRWPGAVLGEAEEEVCELCLPRPGERPGSGVRGGAHRDSRSTYVARSAESKMRRCVAPRRLGGSKSVPQFEGSVASSAASVLGWVVACTRVFSACGVPESAPALQSERERAVATKWTRTATGGGESGRYRGEEGRGGYGGCSR